MADTTVSHQNRPRVWLNSNLTSDMSKVHAKLFIGRQAKGLSACGLLSVPEHTRYELGLVLLKRHVGSTAIRTSAYAALELYCLVLLYRT